MLVELPNQQQFHGAVVRPNLKTMDLSKCPMVCLLDSSFAVCMLVTNR